MQTKKASKFKKQKATGQWRSKRAYQPPISNGRQYSHFENRDLKLGTETFGDILLKNFGGRPCKSVNGLVLRNRAYVLVS